MPYADPQKQREVKAEWARKNYERQKDLKEEEENLTILLLWDNLQQIDKNKEELARMKADPGYVSPEEYVPRHFQPLPELYIPLLDRLTASDPTRRNRVHAKLSQFYYGMSRSQRAEAAVQATVKIQERKAEELHKDLEAADRELNELQWKEGIKRPSREKAETFVQRLERFAYCAKHLKDKGFSWFVTSEACGKSYLESNDFLTLDELREKQRGVDSYVPGNKYWNLRGEFPNHAFVERPGDLDWMREWALSEREECILSEEKEWQDYKNMVVRVKAAESIQLKAANLFLTEKLSVDEALERLKPEKDAVLDDGLFKVCVMVVKEKLDEEEKKRIFTEKADTEFEESASPSPTAKGSTKIKTRIVDDDKEVTE